MDDLNQNHIQRCQPNLKKGESGFLKIGDAPAKNIEQWVQDVQLIRDQGILARPTSAKSAPTKINEDDTVTSEDENPGNDSQAKYDMDDDNCSLVFFGSKKLKASSKKVKKASDTKPKNKRQQK